MNVIGSMKNTLCFGIAISMLVLAGCGGGTESTEPSQPASQPQTQANQQPAAKDQTIRVVAMQVGSELNPEALETMVTEYASSRDTITVEFSVVQADPSQPQSIPKALENADLAIFSSLLHSALRPRIESFYPIPANDETSALPSTLPAVYASMEQSAHWAVPLVLDPVVMVMKRDMANRIGEPVPVESWAKIQLMKTVTTQGGIWPQMGVVTSTPLAIADSAAVLALGYGFHANHLRSDWTQEMLPVDRMMDVQAMGFAGLGRTLVDPTEGDSLIQELPVYPTLTDFLDSEAQFTFVRYSAWLAENPELKSSSFSMIAPGPQGKSTVVYALSAAVPMTSSAPDAAANVVRYLQDNASAIAEAHSMFDPYSMGSAISELNLDASTAILVRENATGIESDLFLGMLRGIAEISDFNTRWSTGFYVPESSL